ncbi:MAG: FMN-binding protein [Myxococcales bacterium]|nr:FMN-binding protein [Myxococcales bacterium]
MSSTSGSAWSSSRTATLAGLIAVSIAGAAPAAGAVFHSRSEALELAFPDADRIERKSFVLTEAQKGAVEEQSRAPLDSQLVTIYTAYGPDGPIGYALIDIHRVRAMNEALLVVLQNDGRVRSLRLLAFYEPPEYMPLPGWLEQFEERSSEDPLRVRGDIHAIAGATLSTRAVTRAVRRSLALFQVLIAPEAHATPPPRGKDE